MKIMTSRLALLLQHAPIIAHPMQSSSKEKNQRVQIGPSSKLEIHNVNLADINEQVR